MNQPQMNAVQYNVNMFSLSTQFAARQAATSIARPVLCVALRQVMYSSCTSRKTVATKNERCPSTPFARLRPTVATTLGLGQVRNYSAQVIDGCDLTSQEREDLTYTYLFAPNMRRTSKPLPSKLTTELLQEAADAYSQVGLNLDTTVALFEDTLKFNASNMSAAQLTDAICSLSELGVRNSETQEILSQETLRRGLTAFTHEEILKLGGASALLLSIR